MPQIVWMARPDGWYIYFNHHWMDYSGLTLEESLGDGWKKPFHPDDRSKVEASWRDAVLTKRVYTVESRLRRADGEYRWWLIRGVPQIDAAGKVLKWFGTCTDIHDLKSAELELFRANRALLMLSACNEKLIRVEREQQLLDEICRIVVQVGGYQMAWVGYAMDDPEHSVEPKASAGVEEGYLSEVKVHWCEEIPTGLGPGGIAIRTGEPAIIEDIETDPRFLPWRAPARERGYRGVICLPLRNATRTFGILTLYSSEILKIENGELKLIIELADDLAFGIEHLRAVRRITRQATLLDAASDSIILRGIGHEILYWNKGAERIYGWEEKQVLGEDARQIYVSDRESFDKHVRTLMEEGTWAGELAMHSRDGREILADARWTLLRDENGNPEAILSIGSDITERKKLENQLLRVQRLESLGTLAGGVAHDLNNVLAPILMGADILKNEVVSDLGQQLLASMEASAKRGADLVRQVLSFARGVEGKRIPVNVVHILNEISNVIHDAFPKNIEFIYLPSRDLWTVLADPTQLHQVFTNLCVNARDAMPNGGTLKVITENTVLDEVYAGMNPEAKPGAYVVVKVDDTGTGIPPAIREKIFEPFFTTKEIGKGTGLGLSTTIGIVKSHAGFINLYSEMGKGTIFKVYLPADTTAAAAENTAIQQSELPRGDGQLVLLVDDESTIRSVAQKTLERYGYRVLLASNGAEAIACYAKSPEQIAVVITDMAMPVMDGPATIVALKALNPEVKIIGSSGIPTNGGVAKAVGAGVKYFVPKPYTAESMLVTLAKALHDPV
jgi:PAS domain S-box-containing protein